MSFVPVAIIGAGPAGLAASAELARRGIAHRVFEAGSCPGYNWTRLYDSLTLHTGKHLSALPGRRFGRDVPLYPTRAQFVDYLARYASGLPIETGRHVSAVARDGERWRLVAGDEVVLADAVVCATGIMSCPRMPDVPQRELYRGRVLHSIEYRHPAPFVGRRVLVVGVGNSGGEIASELARAGARVTLAVRSGANVVPRDIAGVPIQYLSLMIRGLPRPVREALSRAVTHIGELRRGPPVLPRPAHGPLDAIPLIGFNLVDAIRDGSIGVKPGLERFTAAGVRFTDGSEEPFDDVILATGFMPALAPFGGLVGRDARGFARRVDRVRSADQRDLYFIGHTYDAAGSLFNIGRDARRIGASLAAARTGVRAGLRTC